MSRLWKYCDRCPCAAYRFISAPRNRSCTSHVGASGWSQNNREPNCRPRVHLNWVDSDHHHIRNSMRISARETIDDAVCTLWLMAPATRPILWSGCPANFKPNPRNAVIASSVSPTLQNCATTMSTTRAVDWSQFAPRTSRTSIHLLFLTAFASPVVGTVYAAGDLTQCLVKSRRLMPHRFPPTSGSSHA